MTPLPFLARPDKAHTAHALTIVLPARRVPSIESSDANAGGHLTQADILEVTDQRVPSAYWQCRDKQPGRALKMIGGHGFTVMRVAGVGWRIAAVRWSHAGTDVPAPFAPATGVCQVTMTTISPSSVPQPEGAFELATAHCSAPIYPPATTVAFEQLDTLADYARCTWSDPCHPNTAASATRTANRVSSAT